MTPGLRVVIADDDRDTAAMLATLLEDEGHVVHSVYHGADVMKTVHIVRPDAVILDMQMPGKSGYAIVDELKALYYGARRPRVIAISGFWTGEADRLLAQRLGVDEYLTKPADPRAVLRMVSAGAGPASVPQGTM